MNLHSALVYYKLSFLKRSDMARGATHR